MRKREKREKKCLSCDELIPIRNKYCNNVCQNRYELKEKFNLIEKGDFESFNTTPKSIHRITKMLLIEKYGNKCMKCGWCEVNEWTGLVPIELNHIDGNPKNQNLDNVELLCPNHHTLTEFYGRRGGGRDYRYNK